MPGPNVQQDGARGLRWLALAVAVAVALPPPLLAARATWQGLQDRAAAIATALAGTMARLQAAEPRLWRHGGAKATGRLLTGPAWHDVRSVEVRDCAGALLARPLPAAPAAAGRGRGPAAWAAIGPSGGWVRVELDGAPVAAAAALVAALALALGLTLGLALWWGPFAALRRAAALREAQVAAAVAQVRALGRASLAAVEAERGRIARDIHDDLGQSLTALRLQVDALHASNAAPGLARARDAIERAIDDLRRVVGDLRPAGLDDDELASALRADAARLEAALDIAVQIGRAHV